jgi:hypothetical protein
VPAVIGIAMPAVAVIGIMMPDVLKIGGCMTVDPFLDLAQRQIASPVKARMRAAQKRAMTKALQERDDAHHLWRLWRRERVEALLASRYGADARALIKHLDHMALSSVDELVTIVQRGPWREADDDTRFEILSLVDAAIIALREKAKLPPFDDPLDGTDAFLEIRSMLRVRDGRNSPGDRPGSVFRGIVT